MALHQYQSASPKRRQNRWVPACPTQSGHPGRPAQPLSSDGHSADRAFSAVLSQFSNDRPTALFSPDSVMTVATFRALKTLGISIPDEVSLMWFDNLEWTRLVSPELSAVSQPVLGMKQSAATELLRRIDGDEDEFRTTFCDTEFVYRASTAPPPSG
ncbi:substrate-binding domain-containing protein [uncultured Microbacterium sp.]|uniref:substrate-binding domain-containing protein n=1 Tax=uncultured Microbacterium sp. TaxID=191216 RepID=UPI00262A08F6|nr:substrate-binding domain-containing protein [uncultured Microbacterium sp.]